MNATLEWLLSENNWSFEQPEVLPLNHEYYTLINIKRKQLAIRTTRSIATKL